MVKRYAIFKCEKCGLPQYARYDQKTRKCLKCGKYMVLKKTWIRGWASDIHEAIYIVQKLKAKKETNLDFTSSYNQFMEK